MKQGLLGLDFAHNQVMQTWVWARDSVTKSVFESWFSERLEARMLHFWGEEGSGTGHLAIATAQALQTNGQRVAFVDLAHLTRLAQFEGLETFPWLVIAHLDEGLGHRETEVALFHLFNGVQAAQGRMLIFSYKPLHALDFVLPDLASRLRSVISYGLPSLSEPQRLEAVQLRARWKGLDISEAIAKQLVKQAGESMVDLMRKLDVLAQEVLIQQRKPSLTLLKELKQDD
jgi:DnaA family protein